MELTLATAVLVSLCISAYLFVKNRRKSGDSGLADTAIQDAILNIEQLLSSSGQPKDAESDTVLRIEVLERRMEQLNKDVLRRLQAVTKKEQRMEQKYETDEDEEMSEETARALIAGETAAPVANGTPTNAMTIAEIEAQA